MKLLRQMGIVFLALILLYSILMIAVYAIPNQWIEGNVESALAVLDAEGPYPHYFFDYPFGQADNSTDKEMYKNMLAAEGDSVLKAAMVPRYARYWQGYAVFLRPFSVFLSISNIRYLNMTALLALLCLCFWTTSKTINLKAALSFLLGLIATNIWLAPFNMQYFTVTLLTLIFSWVAVANSRWKRPPHPAVLFLCFGSLTAFADYLTFPILTLGYPLLLMLLLRKQTLKTRTFRSELFFLLACSASWVAGYGLTLLSKGVVGTLFSGTNVLQDILESSLYRINGELPFGYYENISAWMSIRYNADAFFNFRNLSLLAACMLCLVVILIRKHTSLKGWTASLPILGVALFPYVWYAALQNHSIMHCYFTFKAQGVAFFALCAFVISLIDFSRRPDPELR